LEGLIGFPALKRRSSSGSGQTALFSLALVSVNEARFSRPDLLCTAIRQNHRAPRGFFKATTASLCSAGFQTCCIADFQVGRTSAIVQSAGLETRDTADLEVCATGVAASPRCVLGDGADAENAGVSFNHGD
jgi:hypothetical protein